MAVAVVVLVVARKCRVVLVVSGICNVVAVVAGPFEVG